MMDEVEGKGLKPFPKWGLIWRGGPCSSPDSDLTVLKQPRLNPIRIAYGLSADLYG